jgi:hypothetical protein
MHERLEGVAVALKRSDQVFWIDVHERDHERP